MPSRSRRSRTSGEIQRRLRAQGIPLLSEVDESGSGPGSFLVADPDGNPILFDQHR